MYDFEIWWMMFKYMFFTSPAFTINTIYVTAAVLAVGWLYGWSLCRLGRWMWGKFSARRKK